MTETGPDPLNWFDFPALGAEWEVNSSRVLKRDLVKQGYDKIMSLYGAVRDKETNELLGVRIEILAYEEYNYEDINYLYFYFDTHPLKIKYSIWIYEREHIHIELMGVYP
jgi:hypothetical protein